MNSTFVRLGAAFGFLGVALGAFGAHGLKSHLTPEMMSVYQTGVLYQMIHAIALVALGVGSFQPAKVRVAGYLFTAGILIFSGSLYALALTGTTVLGAITPLGGVCFLAGWAVLFLAAGAVTKTDRP